jgi:hypothetical protein
MTVLETTETWKLRVKTLKGIVYPLTPFPIVAMTRMGVSS